MSMPTEAELTGIEHDRLRVEIALTDLNELPLDDLLSFLSAQDVAHVHRG